MRAMWGFFQVMGQVIEDRISRHSCQSCLGASSLFLTNRGCERAPCLGVATPSGAAEPFVDRCHFIGRPFFRVMYESDFVLGYLLYLPLSRVKDKWKQETLSDPEGGNYYSFSYCK